MISSIRIIYASTSGHTEYVVNVLKDFLAEKAKDLEVTLQSVESANPDDLLKGDLLILASATWNIGATEGHMNPHLHTFLYKDAKDIDLTGRNVGIIALGDTRYFFTSRASERIRNYIQESGGTVFGFPMTIVNEPYGQEDKVARWGEKFLTQLQEV